MRREAGKHFYNMLQAAELLAQFTQGKSFAQYRENALLRSAVERQLGIIGEALNRLRQVNPETAARISDARRIIGPGPRI